MVLRQSLENYRHLLKQMELGGAELEKALAIVVVNPVPVPVPAAERPPPPGGGGQVPEEEKIQKLKSRTGLKRDLSEELTRACGVDLTKSLGSMSWEC